MKYELAKKLKGAGFTWRAWSDACDCDDCITAYPPTLSELIEACGDSFSNLQKDFYESKWACNVVEHSSEGGTFGETPEEAVANQWLHLKSNQ